MASAAFDLTTAFLDQPATIGYGLVRGAGNLVLQQQLADNSTLAFYVLGAGPWDSLLRLWVNRNAIALPSAIAHFHPGLDGEIGNGMAAVSTGGDQHVDAFWSSVPTLSSLTYSRYAWLALKVPPDPGAPSASLEVLADYQAMRCRIFDNAGNQTAFQWTQNPAWWICDRIIRKFILREAKVNQPLVAAELARFDWQSFADAASYYDADIGGGIKRFSDGGVVVLDASLTEDRVLEQLLLMCRSYILERNGKISLYADKPRASVFTFTTDNVKAGTFLAKKANLRSGKNQVKASWREIATASGSADDATRFGIGANTFRHEAHQRAIGVRGPGLSVIPKALELQLDFGHNTAERVARLALFQLRRPLGDDVDENALYNAPFGFNWTGFEDSLAVEPGDVVTADGSLSEEFAGVQIEVLTVEEDPSGDRLFTGLAYEANVFGDSAPTQQAVEAPVPGNGLTTPMTLDPSGNLLLANADKVAADGSTFGRVKVAGLSGNNVRKVSLDGVTLHDAKGVGDSQILPTRETSLVNSQWSFTTSNILTQSGTSTTINIAAATAQFGFGQVSYNSGSVNPGSYGTFFIYADDPTGAGGAVTFQFTNNYYDANAGEGRIYFGAITTSSGGGGVGGGGGGGTGHSCFSPNTRVETQRGPVRFDALAPGDVVCTALGTWRSILAVVHRPYRGEMRAMGNCEFVTPTHLLLREGSWLPAREIFDKAADYDGEIWNAIVDADDDWARGDTEHSYTLANGLVAHNPVT